ncbi:MAG: (2Fe-2S) ferredoxin domain-containing protein [Spirochaetes bacterium]|nr:(2Fe-2S) ferredoxin domain-containing protein [Spirochaetota bacterium]
MAKMSLEDLRKMKDEKKKILDRREVGENDIVIRIGMATCGIAAGAKKTMEALFDEIEKQGLNETTIKQSGCMGYCDKGEPTVEVKVPGMPDTIYGAVNEDFARRIIKEHCVQRKLVDGGHIFDRPSRDILKE